MANLTEIQMLQNQIKELQREREESEAVEKFIMKKVSAGCSYEDLLKAHYREGSVVNGEGVDEGEVMKARGVVSSVRPTQRASARVRPQNVTGERKRGLSAIVGLELWPEGRRTLVDDHPVRTGDTVAKASGDVLGGERATGASQRGGRAR